MTTSRTQARPPISSSWYPILGLTVTCIDQSGARMVVAAETAPATNCKCPACGYGKLTAASSAIQTEIADIPADGQQVVIVLRRAKMACSWCDEMNVQPLPSWVRETDDGRAETIRLAEHRAKELASRPAPTPAATRSSAWILERAPTPVAKAELSPVELPSPPPSFVSTMEREAEAFRQKLLQPKPAEPQAFRPNVVPMGPPRSKSGRVVEVFHKPARRKLSLGG